MSFAERDVLLAGVDFTSMPTRRKPIVVATGRQSRGVVRVERLDEHDTFGGLADWLAQPGPWVAGFDFPFGLPRELVEALHWPATWHASMRHFSQLSRDDVRCMFAAFCNSRPVGAKFAHRATDGPAGASPSMRWVNPPVALMMHAGVPLLLDAGVAIPGLHPGDERRVALETYPGLVARELIGRRPYKSDEKAKQTPERLIARKDLVEALEQGRTRLGVRVRLSHAMRDALVADATGDRLDAVLCLVLAAWGAHRPGLGLPAGIDPLEGWIVGA